MLGGYIPWKKHAENSGNFRDIPVGQAIEIAPERPNRFEITITNDSDTIIYLKLGSGATMNSGIRLNAHGGRWQSNAWSGAISAVHGDALAAKRVLVAEA